MYVHIGAKRAPSRGCECYMRLILCFGCSYHPLWKWPSSVLTGTYYSQPSNSLATMTGRASLRVKEKLSCDLPSPTLNRYLPSVCTFDALCIRIRLVARFESWVSASSWCRPEGQRWRLQRTWQNWLNPQHYQSTIATEIWKISQTRMNFLVYIHSARLLLRL